MLVDFRTARSLWLSLKLKVTSCRPDGDSEASPEAQFLGQNDRALGLDSVSSL